MTGSIRVGKMVRDRVVSHKVVPDSDLDGRQYQIDLDFGESLYTRLWG